MVTPFSIFTWKSSIFILSLLLFQSLSTESTLSSLTGPHLLPHPTVQISSLDCARVYPNPQPSTISHLYTLLLLYSRSFSQCSICCSLTFALFTYFDRLFYPSRAAALTTGGHSLTSSHLPPFLSSLPSPPFFS